MRRPLSASALLLACAACGSRSDAARADTAPADSAPVPVQATPSRSAARSLSAAAASEVAASGGQEIRGVRTSLNEADCETVSVDEEAGGSTQRCPGTAGYRLLALDGDARMSITVVDRSGAEHPLDFWTTVTGGFSSLGDAAEWRVRGAGASAVPVALIVPLKAHEDPETPERVTDYRIVAKVTPAATCVTHRLPAATPDGETRRLADASAGQPCLAPDSDQ